jgi:hypothetical protein
MGKSEMHLNWAEGTLRIALTAIVAHCERTQYFNPTADQLVHRRIEHVIKGAARLEHQVDKQRRARAQRLPLMPAHIDQLLSEHEDVIPADESLVFSAAIRTASVTLVRMGNLLATKQLVDPSSDLTMRHVTFMPAQREMFMFALPKTKTSVAGAEVYVTNSKKDNGRSAFKALQAYHTWRIRANPSGPDDAYFITSQGLAYTKKMALTTLRLLLTENGDDAMSYGLHSTRQGGATALTEAGIAEASILAAGGWKSSKMLQIYAKRPSREKIADMQQRMEQSTGVFSTRAEKSPKRRKKQA